MTYKYPYTDPKWVHATRVKKFDPVLVTILETQYGDVGPYYGRVAKPHPRIVGGGIVGPVEHPEHGWLILWWSPEDLLSDSPE